MRARVENISVLGWNKSNILIHIAAPFFKILICDVIYGSDTFPVVKFLIGRKLIDWFTMDIWWVIIFFIFFIILLFFRISFLLLISCDIFIGLTSVELFSLVFWLDNSRVFILGLVHYWDSLDSIKCGHPLVISVCFSFVDSSYTLCISWSFIGNSVYMYAWICFPVASNMK